MREPITQLQHRLTPPPPNEPRSDHGFAIPLRTPFNRLALIRNQLKSGDKGIGEPPGDSIAPVASSTRMAELKKQLEDTLDRELLVFGLCHDTDRFAELSGQIDPDSREFLKEQGAAWREKLMEKLTPEYAKLRQGAAVFCWFCHPKMYGGGFVTHLSAVVVAKTANGPEVMVFHHESIPIGEGRGSYQDGRMHGYLGIRVFGYDTRDWFHRVTGRLPQMKDIPAVKSLLLGGFPSVKLTTVDDYEKGKQYAERCMRVSERNWPELYYAPHAALEERECAAFYPPPCGEAGPHFRQINNCYLSTVDLYTAMSGDRGPRFKRYSIERMGDDLRKAGLLPRTTEKAFDDILREKPGPKSFFLYTSQAGVNPQGPDGFEVEGNLVQKLREHNMRNDQYVSLMRKLNLKPPLKPPLKPRF
jgi:hypothetical protein